MAKFHLKIVCKDQITKVIPLLRKYTGLGIAEIKDRVINEQPILTFNGFDDDECETVKKIIAGIQEHSGKVRLYNEDYSEELSIEYFYNLQKQSEETSKYLQDMTDFECTKILISINQEYIEIINKEFKAIKQEGDDIVVELEYDKGLMDLLQIIIDNQINAKVYQVELDQNCFNDEDEVSPIEILENYKKYF